VKFRLKYSSKKIRKFEKRILMYIILVSLFPVVILGSTSYYTIVKNATSQRNAASQSELIQVMQNTDNMLENIKEHYGGVAATSKEVERLLENIKAHENYIDIQAFIERMTSEKTFIHYIEGYTLVDFRNKITYGNQGIYREEELNNWRELEQLLETSSERPIYWQNNMNIQWSGDHPSVELKNLSLIYRLPFLVEDKYAMLVVNLNRNEMEKLLAGERSFGGMVVLDANGELLYGTRTPFDTVVMQQSQMLLDSNEKAAADEALEQTFKYDGETYYMSKIVSSNSEWTYIAYYDMQITRSGANEIMILAIVVGVLMLGIVFIMSLFGTYQIYKPMRNTFNNIRDYLEAEDSQQPEKIDEFDYLEQGVSHLYASNKELATTIELQKEQLTELFVLRLISGKLTVQAIEANAEILQLKEYEYMAVMLISSTNYKEGKKLTEAERDIMYLTMAREIPREVREALITSPVGEPGNIVLLVGAESQKLLEHKITLVYDLFKVYTKERFDRLLRAGISRSFSKITQFRVAYHEALEALKVERQNKEQKEEELLDSRFTYFEDVAQADYKTSAYSMLMQAQIKEAVDRCDERRAFLIVDQFIEEMEANKIRMNEQYFFMYRFMITILVVAADAGLNINKIYEEKQGNLFQEFNNLYSLDEISRFYKEKLICPIIFRLKDFRKNSRTVIMEKIEHLVLEMGGDITLTECAERIQCHANYIWRIMKEQRGQTFSEFIAEIRMEKAKELLLKTESSIGEIAEELNFTNSQNFIRYFKKHAQITPGQYRKEMNN